MNLNDYRKEIDAVDEELLRLFMRRMDISLKIAEAKRQAGLPTKDEEREALILRKRAEQAGELSPYAEELFRCLFAQSRAIQEKVRQEAEENDQ